MSIEEQNALFGVPLPEKPKNESLEETIKKATYNVEEEKRKQKLAGELLFPKKKKGKRGNQYK